MPSTYALLTTQISKLQYKGTAQDARIKELLADVEGLRRTIDLVASEHNALLQRNDMLREIVRNVTAAIEDMV
jgi:regulator of replication initiation timing